MEWQAAERVQKNDAGQFRALIGGEWVPAEKAQKNEAGEFRVLLAAPTSTPPRSGNPLVDQIPGSNVKAPASTAAPEKPESGFLGKLISPLETAVALGTSAVTAPIVGAAKIGGTLTSGKFGTPAGIRAGEETGRKVQQFFQPELSREAEGQTQAIGNALSSIGMEGVPLNVLGELQRGLTPALRAGADMARAPVAARAARIQEANVAKSYANAPMIDAVQSAQRIGGAVPPAISNPTTSNVIKGKLAGPEIEQQFAKKNEAAVTEAVRKDLGIKPTEKLIPEVDEATGKLNVNSPIARALDEASKPYEPIRKMESLAVPAESIEALEKLRKAAPIGGDAKTAAINGVIDDALAKLQQTTTGPFSGVGGGPVAVGRSGAMVLDDIRSLKRDAQATRRAQQLNPDPLAIAKAEAQESIVKILEGVIDANAPSPKILNDMKKARTRMAQIYEHENAINYGQQKIDPQAYAKMYEERQGGMTGLNADIAKAASMFPDYFTLTPAEIKGMPRLTRGGVGAAFGGALGAPLGPLGFVAGTAAGMGVGSAAGSLAARRMSTPAYQRANAMPADYRPVPSGLTPADINYGPNQLVPYNYAQQTTQAPNFVLRSGQQAPAYEQPSYPQLTQFGDYETTVNALRNQEARAGERSRAAGQQVEAQQAAAEARTRKPASGEVILDWDPITKTYREASQGLKGATPETFQNFGSSLASAAEKATAGKTFDMSAAEKVAWDKTKVDLAKVMPGLKGLDDKAVATKMMDREWVQQAIDKAKQMAKMQDEAIARSTNERARQLAMIEREKLQGSLEMLEEQFRKARPVKTGGQGPKTRAHQRNMLRPEGDDIQNALVK